MAETVEIDKNKKKMPNILKAFIYDEATIMNQDNKIKCKGCFKDLSFCLSMPTSNLVKHIMFTNRLKHLAYREEYETQAENSPAKIHSKRKLENAFESTSPMTSQASKNAKFGDENQQKLSKNSFIKI